MIILEKWNGKKVRLALKDNQRGCGGYGLLEIIGDHYKFTHDFRSNGGIELFSDKELGYYSPFREQNGEETIRIELWEGFNTPPSSFIYNEEIGDYQPNDVQFLDHRLVHN